MSGMSILHLYSDRVHQIETQEIVSYLKDVTSLDVSDEGYFFAHWKPDAETAKKLAELKVIDFANERALNNEPTKKEVSLEKKYLLDGEPISFDVEHVYEGFGFAEILRRLVKPKKREYHIVFTSRMLATWERNRYHGRAIVCSLPLSVVSTTGMVEAPAKPKEYYAKLMARQKAQEIGILVPDEENFELELRTEFADRILDYDERLTEALKGYALQALSYFYTFNAFCQDPDCRLYNAHTQEELIHAQLKSGKICKDHQEIFRGR